MSRRDLLFFSITSFILGLLLGTFFVAPRLSPRSPDVPRAAVPTPRPAAGAKAGSEMMEVVRERVALLKQQIGADPNDAQALADLGNLYMSAAKYPEAIEYLGRAWELTRNPHVGTDLGICYRNAQQYEKALSLFREIQKSDPSHWQSVFNEAVVLFDTGRNEEARVIVKRLRKEYPDESVILALEKGLDGKKG